MNGFNGHKTQNFGIELNVFQQAVYYPQQIYCAIKFQEGAAFHI